MFEGKKELADVLDNLSKWFNKIERLYRVQIVRTLSDYTVNYGRRRTVPICVWSSTQIQGQLRIETENKRLRHEDRLKQWLPMMYVAKVRIYSAFRL